MKDKINRKKTLQGLVSIAKRKIYSCMISYHSSMMMYRPTYLYYTKILQVNLFAFAYRLFHEDFSSIDRTLPLVISLPLVIPEYI